MLKFNGLVQACLRRFGAAVLALSVVACGGGGGSGGDPINGGGGGGGGTPTPTPPATMTVELSSNTVTVASPGTVKVTLKNRAGAALPGYVVTFTTNLNLGAFSAPSALTDANGVATVQVQPASGNSTGADTVLASTTVDSTVISASIGFQMTATNVTLTSFTSDIATLAAYGQTSLTAQLAGTTAGSPVNIVATSTCVANGKATLTPTSVSTTTGRAVFTYRDNGCGAVATSDAVQISVTGTTITGSVSLGLTSPAVSSIAFVSASPDTIYLKGSGYVENSNVKFRVNDASGNGVPEQSVEFEPTTLAGGLLVEGVQTKVTKRTDSNGEVTVRVNAGTVPTPVRVKATLVGSAISTVSSNLNIAVGLPSQLNFSLSQGTINIEGYDYDGTPNTYTIIASDRLANPVPEGTAINFVAEAGQIQATQQTTVTNGLSRSTANYASAQPKPLDGRVTVVAYALGEESFLDINGNNVFDAGEDYQDLGDIFIDRLFNFGGRDKSTFYVNSRFNPTTGYNVSEDQFVGLSLGGAATCRQSVSSLLDLRHDIPVKPGSCTTGWGRAYVRRSIETILSRSTPFLNWGVSMPANHAAPAGFCPAKRTLLGHYDGTDAPRASILDTDQDLAPLSYHAVSGTMLFGYVPEAGGSIPMRLADTNPIAYNPMPAGTTISVAATTGLTVSVGGGTPVPSTAYPTGLAINYKFDANTSSGTITITTRTPLGLGTAISFELRGGPPPAGYVTCP